MGNLKKGTKLTVEPIRNIKDIQTISKLIADKPRDHLLFVLGINNGLRASDIIRLKVGDVRDMKPGDILNIQESKTGKNNVLVVNNSVHKAIRCYLNAVKPDDNDYLFPSRKGNSHIRSQAVGKMVQAWAKAINLKGKYGAHTLRKTWGYIQRTVHGVGFEIICKRYNHSNPSITMRYLGIQSREVHDVLMNEIG